MNTLQQKQLKILMIGEACSDVYVFGEVKRISPEAPVPVLKKQKKEFKKGMSGNVYENINSILNCSIDHYHNDLKKIKKIRFVDSKSKYQLMRYDIEKDLEEISFENIENLKDDYDAIVISDYDKGFLSREFIEKITTFFAKTKIFVDTKKKDLSCFKNSLIKLNESEKFSSFNLDPSSDIITTLGSNGCKFKSIIYPSKPVEVYDVCGAGDVFLAALVSRWLENNDLISSIKTANNCAALSVTKLGCYTLSRKEYENLCV